MSKMNVNISANGSSTEENGPTFENDYLHPFDLLHIKVIFSFLYGLVFVGAFVGEYTFDILQTTTLKLGWQQKTFLVIWLICGSFPGCVCLEEPNNPSHHSPLWVQKTGLTTPLQCSHTRHRLVTHHECRCELITKSPSLKPFWFPVHFVGTQQMRAMGTLGISLIWQSS